MGLVSDYDNVILIGDTQTFELASSMLVNVGHSMLEQRTGGST